MQFKDYYQTMGVDKGASPEDIKRAHRKLARKFHPDVSQHKDAEARFKDLAEAYDVLKDPEKRAAYDDAAREQHAGQDFTPPPDWQRRATRRAGTAAGDAFDGGQGFENGGGHSEFFDALFKGMGSAAGQHKLVDRHGQDQHARIEISLEDVYLGAKRIIDLRTPTASANGNLAAATRTLEFSIAKGVRAGQHIRLAGQGLPGSGQGHAGDLYLEVAITPHPLWHLDASSPLDVSLLLPITPWEAALGADIEAPTPTGRVEVKIAPGSYHARKLRLKGRGLPGTSAGQAAGDFYFVLQVVCPPAESAAGRRAYTELASAFTQFNARSGLDNEHGFAAASARAPHATQGAAHDH